MKTVGSQRISGPDLGPANWSRRYEENLERLRSLVFAKYAPAMTVT